MQETQSIEYENRKCIRLYNPKITSFNIEINWSNLITMTYVPWFLKNRPNV